MIITCNNCESRFNIDERLIKPQGSKVKCSKCQTVFTVLPPQKEEVPPPPPPKPMPRLLDDDEDSGVDIQKDFVRKSPSPRPARKPMFEEPDVVDGGSDDAPSSATAPAPPVRTPRRPSRPAAMAGGTVAVAATSAVAPASAACTLRQRPVRRSVPPDGLPPKRPPALETPPEPLVYEDADTMAAPESVTPPMSAREPAPSKGRAPKPAKAQPAKGKGKTFAKAPKKDKKEKSGSSLGKKLLLLIILIIILLAVTVFVLPKVGVQVPFIDKLGISNLLGGGSTNEPAVPTLPSRGGGQQQPVTDPAGGVRISITPEDKNGIINLFMNPEDVNSGLMGNTAGGVLTIVEGQIANNYDVPRKAIKVVGRLFNSNYELVQEKTVYAGNLLTEEELVTLSPEEIETRLYGSDSQATVAPKSNVPFMIVFSNMPEPVQNYVYECEIISSESAAN